MNRRSFIKTAAAAAAGSGLIKRQEYPSDDVHEMADETEDVLVGLARDVPDTAEVILTRPHIPSVVGPVPSLMHQFFGGRTTTTVDPVDLDVRDQTDSAVVDSAVVYDEGGTAMFAVPLSMALDLANVSDVYVEGISVDVR